MEKLAKDGRAIARGLYAGFPGLNGAIDSALEGVLGEVFVDDRSGPRVARIAIGDFHVVAGDAEATGAREALLAVPDRDYLAVPESWHELVRPTLPNARSYDRSAFQAPVRWDRARLATMRESLPTEFKLQRIDGETVAAFRKLNATFVDNFESAADFLERGVGSGVTTGGEMVAGCSSYAISPSRIEFEIETRRDYQRRGLALVTGACLIEHCLDNGLEPCWDAAHEGSARLAEALGFVGRMRYLSYRLGALQTPES